MGVDERTVFAMDTPAEGFWREGHFQGHNIWSGGGKNAPFDRPVSRGASFGTVLIRFQLAVFSVVHFTLKSVLCVFHLALKSILCVFHFTLKSVCFPPRPEVCFVCVGHFSLKSVALCVVHFDSKSVLCVVRFALKSVTFVCGPLRLEVCFVCNSVVHFTLKSLL